MKRVLILMAAALVCPGLLADVVAEGRVEGMIRFAGEIPKSGISDDAGVRRDLMVVDGKGRGVQNVVLWLVREDGKELGGGTNEVAKLAPAVMDQLDHEFVPRVLAVRAGQTVKFTNSDPANHNVRTSSGERTNEFNVFTGIDGSYTHRFVANPEQRPVRLGCDIHPWMRAWIYVFEHPCFAVTDEVGRYSIEKVPAGNYRLLARQPDVRFSEERAVTIARDGMVRADFEIQGSDKSDR